MGRLFGQYDDQLAGWAGLGWAGHSCARLGCISQLADWLAHVACWLANSLLPWLCATSFSL